MIPATKYVDPLLTIKRLHFMLDYFEKTVKEHWRYRHEEGPKKLLNSAYHRLTDVVVELDDLMKKEVGE